MSSPAFAPNSAPLPRTQSRDWLIVASGLLALYVPTLYDLFRTVWSTDAQGHGPIVLGLGIWLIWRRWAAINDTAVDTPKPLLGWSLVALAIALYLLGRPFEFPIFEVGSAIVVIAGLTLLMRGAVQLRSMWFALFFLLFLIPLPAIVVDALTQPMKMAVSWVVEALLHAMGYPIARTGVILQIGQYQLLVADACAGLHTLFTLEAMGLLYLNVVRTSSLLRNVGLAILIVPISFAANVIRVAALSLITYYLGDAAGQGFLHGFAGMVLFSSALLLIISIDSLLRIAAKAIHT